MAYDTFTRIIPSSTSLGEIARPTTGGGIYPNQYYNYTNPFIENFVKEMDNYFKGKNDIKEVLYVKTNRKTRKNKRN